MALWFYSGWVLRADVLAPKVSFIISWTGNSNKDCIGLQSANDAEASSIKWDDFLLLGFGASNLYLFLRLRVREENTYQTILQ